jgi:hypothetical protein
VATLGTKPALGSGLAKVGDFCQKLTSKKKYFFSEKFRFCHSAIYNQNGIIDVLVLGTVGYID